MRILVLVLTLGQVALAQASPYTPKRVTEQTLRDEQALSDLQRAGKVLFEDGFESEASLSKYFEIRGLKEGRVKLETDKKLARSGSGCLRCTAPANDGKASGSGASAWLGAKGHERIHYRRYIRFAKDYDQGNLNHTGGGLAGVAGTGKWDGMGKAGVRPNGADRFTSGFEPWRDWGRAKLPGYMMLYTYWVDMQKGKDGNWWGNHLEPKKSRRVVPPRGQWVCLEQMIKTNTPGKADGELAAWIDGNLYVHYENIRWRTTPTVTIKRFDLGIYIHKAQKPNTVWYDDVKLSTGYIGR